MENICGRNLKAAALALLVSFLPQAASAVPVALTLEEEPIFQQTDNSPCIIGDPSCHNPSNFDFTLIPSNTDAATLDSPIYTIDQLRAVAGNTFDVGIDLQEPDNDYSLNSFTLTIDGNVAFQFLGGTILLQNHGNGFSDYVLTLFDLSGYSGTSEAFFTVNFSDAQATREQFFLAAADREGNSVPEPSVVLLLLTAAGAAAIRRGKLLA